AATAAAGALLARLGLVDRQPAALELGAVHRLDGGLRAVGHLDEPEPAAAARLPVADHLGLGDRPVLAEQLVEVGRRGRERQVSDVQILAGHGNPPRAVAETVAGNASWTDRDRRGREEVRTGHEPSPRHPAGGVWAACGRYGGTSNLPERNGIGQLDELGA